MIHRRTENVLYDYEDGITISDKIKKRQQSKRKRKSKFKKEMY